LKKSPAQKKIRRFCAKKKFAPKRNFFVQLRRFFTTLPHGQEKTC